MIEQVLRAILPVLESLGIPYLLTGGIAVSMHGRPRFTQAIDIVIAPTATRLFLLIDALDSGFIVCREAAREAYTRGGEFNAIHRTLVFKVDFWFSTGNTFDRSRLGRAQSIEVAPGLIAKVATPRGRDHQQASVAAAGSDRTQRRRHSRHPPGALGATRLGLS